MHLQVDVQSLKKDLPRHINQPIVIDILDKSKSLIQVLSWNSLTERRNITI